MLQVIIPVHILFASNETELADRVHSGPSTLAALQQCVAASLASLQPGWPGTVSSIVEHLRSQGAVAGDAEATASLEVTLVSGAEVVPDVCPAPDVDAVASATAEEVLSDFAKFLEHDVGPTLAQLDVVESSVQVRPERALPVLGGFVLDP